MGQVGGEADGVFPISALHEAGASEAYLQAVRGAFAQHAATVPPSTGRDVAVTGVVSCRVYGEDPEQRRPGVVYAHGGGWVAGDLEMHDQLCARLADAAHAVVVSVDYRLAPEHPYPTPVEDVVTAYRWVLQQATALGVDPERITLMGSSAGGTLVLQALGRIRNETPPTSVVLAYPPLDPALETSSAREFSVGHVLERQQMRWFWHQYLGIDSEHGSEPVTMPDLPDPRTMPPTLVIAAEYDVLRDEVESFAFALGTADRLAGLHRYPGTEHGFLGNVGTSDAALAAINQIARHIGAGSHRPDS